MAWALPPSGISKRRTRRTSPTEPSADVALTNSRGVAGAFGAKVWVYEAGRLGEAGHLIGFQEARSATGYCCQDPPVLHFGLGARTTCDLRVQFLEGPVVERKGVQADAVAMFSLTEFEDTLHPPAAKKNTAHQGVLISTPSAVQSEGFTPVVGDEHHG